MLTTPKGFKAPVNTYPILKFFEFAHLPERLQKISEPFGTLAVKLAEELPPGPEVSVALRKLLEAKDAAVRAGLDQTPPPSCPPFGP